MVSIQRSTENEAISFLESKCTCGNNGGGDCEYCVARFAFSAERGILIKALKEIAWHEHSTYGPIGNSPYEVGVVDGHRCAATVAKIALAQLGITGI